MHSLHSCAQFCAIWAVQAAQIALPPYRRAVHLGRTCARTTDCASLLQRKEVPWVDGRKGTPPGERRGGRAGVGRGTSIEAVQCGPKGWQPMQWHRRDRLSPMLPPRRQRRAGPARPVQAQIAISSVDGQPIRKNRALGARASRMAGWWLQLAEGLAAIAVRVPCGWRWVTRSSKFWRDMRLHKPTAYQVYLCLVICSR